MLLEVRRVAASTISKDKWITVFIYKKRFCDPKTEDRHSRHVDVLRNVECRFGKKRTLRTSPNEYYINPLRPNNDASQTSHCNIKGVSVSEVVKIENMIT